MASPKAARVALVTGSSSGIGRAVADRLVATGWTVWGGSRREAMLPAGSAGRPAWTPVPLDVTSDASVGAAIARALAADGRIDALIHCAGVSVAGAIEDVTIAEAEHQLAINYFGTVRMVQALLPVMRRAGSGRLVIIGSIGGLIGLPFIGHYSASKFALDGMVQALRVEIAPLGIEAAVVHPGDIQTDISANQVEGANTGAQSVYHARFKATVGAYDQAVNAARGPEIVAMAVARLLARRRLPPRVIVGTPSERAGVGLKAVLPPRIFEMILRKTYRL